MCDRCVAGFDYLTTGGVENALAVATKMQAFAEKAVDIVTGGEERVEIEMVLSHGELLGMWFLFTKAAVEAPSEFLASKCMQMREIVGVMLDSIESGENESTTELSGGMLNMERRPVEGDLPFIPSGEEWKHEKPEGPSLN